MAKRKTEASEAEEAAQVQTETDSGAAETAADSAVEAAAEPAKKPASKKVAIALVPVGNRKKGSPPHPAGSEVDLSHLDDETFQRMIALGQIREK